MIKFIEVTNKVSIPYDNMRDWEKADFIADKLKRHMKVQERDTRQIADRLLELSLEDLKDVFNGNNKKRGGFSLR